MSASRVQKKALSSLVRSVSGSVSETQSVVHVIRNGVNFTRWSSFQSLYRNPIRERVRGQKTLSLSDLFPESVSEFQSVVRQSQKLDLYLTPVDLPESLLWIGLISPRLTSLFIVWKSFTIKPIFARIQSQQIGLASIVLCLLKNSESINCRLDLISLYTLHQRTVNQK